MRLLRFHRESTSTRTRPPYRTRRRLRALRVWAVTPVLALPLMVPAAGVNVLAQPEQDQNLDEQGNFVDDTGNRANVDGSLPLSPTLDMELLTESQNAAPRMGALDPSIGDAQTTETDRDRLPDGPLGIPGSLLEAYTQAAGTMDKNQPGCRMHWSLLAGVGRIESGHARGGNVDNSGSTRSPILGPVLNGAGPVAAIPDTDNGALDGDTTWDRAVGPMQFIPSTWRRWATDGNGNGEADPHNIYDATLAAARYLCSAGVDTADPEGRAEALFRYNRSHSYVRTVMRWADAYANGVHPTEDATGPVGGLDDAATVHAAGGETTPPSPEPPQVGPPPSQQPSPTETSTPTSTPDPTPDPTPTTTPTTPPGPDPTPTGTPPSTPTSTSSPPPTSTTTSTPTEPPECETDEPTTNTTPNTTPSGDEDEDEDDCEPEPSESPTP